LFNEELERNALNETIRNENEKSETLRSQIAVLKADLESASNKECKNLYFFLRHVFCFSGLKI
jgi:2-phospho-L-lactate guanylyltransferase (CobY/MobA/RfbA family)